MKSQVDQHKIESMREGGKALRAVKKELQAFTKIGTTFEQIEAEAQRLIKATGFTPSFSTVPGYHWATCLMVNDAMCHGIPEAQSIKAGDVVTIDVGLIAHGFHLDTTISFGVGKLSGEAEAFLSTGKQSLRKAIEKTRVGASVYDVSHAMQKTVEKKGYGAVYQLTGHGVGKELHEDPAIPCQAYRSDKKIHFYEGQTVAVEIMYTMGDPELVVDPDGWTYRTADGSLSAMFEDTILVTAQGPEVLT